MTSAVSGRPMTAAFLPASTISRPATHRYAGPRLTLPMQEVHFLCTCSASLAAKRLNDLTWLLAFASS